MTQHAPERLPLHFERTPWPEELDAGHRQDRSMQDQTIPPDPSAIDVEHILLCTRKSCL